jgi:peptidoglycan/xylan/chitin deacetylase (PgdA/CDA1 family)
MLLTVLGGLALLLLLLLAGFGARWLTYVAPIGKSHRRANTTRRLVALTFDDGPDPRYTAELLKVLRGRQVKATFFMLGRRIEENPDLAKQVHAAGHELGNHSYSHPRMVFRTPAFVRDEIEKTDRLLEGIGAKAARLFRAPYGQQLLTVPYVLSRMGKANIRWNVDPEDFGADDSGTIASSVLSQVGPGSIILLHDNQPHTPAAVDRIVEELSARGFGFVTVGELLGLA